MADAPTPPPLDALPVEGLISILEIVRYLAPDATFSHTAVEAFFRVHDLDLATLATMKPEPQQGRQRRRYTPVPVHALPGGLWRTEDVAKHLGRSVSYVYKAAKKGKLPTCGGDGRELRFDPAVIQALALTGKG